MFGFSFVTVTNDRIIWSQRGKGGLPGMEILSCFAMEDLLHRTNLGHLVLKVCLLENCAVKITSYYIVDGMHF